MLCTQDKYLAFADEGVQSYLLSTIERACVRGASDIHFEPLLGAFRVRFRIDGVLNTVETLQDSFYLSLVSVLKLFANLDIAEKRIPQDGRCKITVGETQVPMRISVLPSVYGESVALRLLQSRKAFQSLRDLGFIAGEEKKLQAALFQPDGLTIVTGPTGAGKTTTLYTLLSQLDCKNKKIISVEDPIEMTLPGVNQVPVQVEGGMTFGSALRSILRQSPDVIMIGEIRDSETAEIAIHAASTGHQVFTSLHANDGVSALIRLLNLGIPPYLLAEYVRCVVSQRLVRHICGCDENSRCSRCHGIGFYGRVGVYHVLPMIAELKANVAKNTSLTGLQATLESFGLGSLMDVGQVLVDQGITSEVELRSVI